MPQGFSQAQQGQPQLQPAVSIQRITPTKAELTRETACTEHPLQCSLCNLPFRSSSNLRFHMVKTHRCSDASAALAATVSANGASENRRYHCPEANCPYSELRGDFFTTMSRLRQHYRWKHMEKKSQCSYCSRRFPSQSLLGLHLRDCGRFFNCEECSRFYRDLKNLRSHFKKTGHGANSIFSLRQRRKPSRLDTRLRQHQQPASVDLDGQPADQEPPVPKLVPAPFVNSSASFRPDAEQSDDSGVNLVIVVTGLGGSRPAASVASVTTDAAAAIATGKAGAKAGGSGDANDSQLKVSRYRTLAPRPLRTVTRSCQTEPSIIVQRQDDGDSYLSSGAYLTGQQQQQQQQQHLLLARSHHHVAPVMVHDHASFRGSTCTNFAVVSFPDSASGQSQQQQQSTMHTQTEYTSPIATDGYSVGVQYSCQAGQSQGVASITQSVCVGSGSSPPITLGIQAGPPDPLEQLLDMETQTNDAFGVGFAGCEMETQTYEEFDWETVFGIVNRRSTGVG